MSAVLALPAIKKSLSAFCFNVFIGLPFKIVSAVAILTIDGLG